MGMISAERMEGGIELSTVACSVRIRWRNDVTADMRVKIQIEGVDTYLDIKQIVKDIARRQFVDLVCVMGAQE